MNIAETIPSPRAFAVWFKELDRWNPGSFMSSDWHWPKEYIMPLILLCHISKASNFLFCFA